MKTFPDAISALRRQPDQCIATCWNQHPASISLGIPHYQANLSRHYQVPASQFDRFAHFGLVVLFDKHTELALHGADMQLPAEAHQLMAEFGPVLLKNAFLPGAIESVGHRNRFPHLNFHRDRNENQPTPYSLFYRNPFDETQKHPRTASTLFVSNQHARKELEVAGQGIPETTDLSHSFLFNEVHNAALISNYLGKLILEQPWNLAEGMGEICLQDNRQLLHASYYRNASQDGYRIGVRYLA
jgi:hypothetical protein